MAWDTAATKQKILDAALAEFAEHGPSGTTVERIASAAGVNKERVYNYFGNKRELFMAVMASESERVAAAVAFDPAADDPVGEYAGRMFDYYANHPQLLRLILWEGLSVHGGVAEEAARTAHYRDKAEAVANAQTDGILRDDLPPGALIFSLMALAGWWHASPHIARMLTEYGDADLAARRAAVVTAARRLAAG
jgi:AcrR family transcriptional regulator